VDIGTAFASVFLISIYFTELSLTLQMDESGFNGKFTKNNYFKK